MSNAIKGKFKYCDYKELFFRPEVLRIAPDFYGRALGACAKSDHKIQSKKLIQFQWNLVD